MLAFLFSSHWLAKARSHRSRRNLTWHRTGCRTDFGRLFNACQMSAVYENAQECTRRSAVAEGPRDALSVEILSTAAQLYTKNRIQKLAMTLTITRRHQKLRYSIGQISLQIRGLTKFIFPANRQSYSAYRISDGRCISVIVYAVN